MLTKPSISAAYLGAIWSNPGNAFDIPAVLGDTTTWASGTATRALAGTLSKGTQWSGFAAFPAGYTFSAKRLVITSQTITLSDDIMASYNIEYFNGTSWIAVDSRNGPAAEEGVPHTYTISLGAGANETAIMVRAYVTADNDGSGGAVSASAQIFDIAIEGDVLTAPAGAGKKTVAANGF